MNNKETPLEELAEKLEEAQNLGLINVVTRVKDEMEMREEVPDINERAVIREIKNREDSDSFRDIVKKHKEEIEKRLNEISDSDRPPS